MNQDKVSFSLKRILVPLDASKHSMTALNIAAELAAAQGAELEGLFVEDINLLQLCEFPFIREITIWGSTARYVDRAETERQLRVRAQWLKKILADVAKSHNVPWKFRVARGGVPAEVLAAAENADLTILGGAGWSMARRPMSGSTVRTLVSRGRGLTLIIQQGMSFQPPVQVLFTGSDLSIKALSVALALSRQKDLSLCLLIAADKEEKLGSVKQLAEKICAGQSVQPAMQIIQKPGPGKIASAVRSRGPGPLFIPCEEPLFSGENLQSLISLSNNPVFLVR